MLEKEEHSVIIKNLSEIKTGDIKGVGSTTLSALENFAHSLALPIDEILPWLGLKYDSGGTLKSIAAMLGIQPATLKNMFVYYGKDIRSSSETTRQRNMRSWQDPEYRKTMTEATRERWQDPEFRTKTIAIMEANWQNPEYRAKQLELIMERLPATLHSPEVKTKTIDAVKRNWQNPEYRAMMASYGSRNLKALWNDPIYRQRQAELSGKRMTQQRKDPDFLRKMVEASSQNLIQLWQNSDFREKTIEASRQAKSNPKNEGKYVLPTVTGVRRGIGFCQSTWEANIGRVLRFVRREYLKGEPFRLSVPEEFQIVLHVQSLTTDFHLDYLTIDPRGNFVGYEIMVHPLEGKEGWLKAELFTQQHPEVRLVLVTDKLYSRLRKRFKDRISKDPDLVGWEDSKDNLRLNPDKWSV